MWNYLFDLKKIKTNTMEIEIVSRNVSLSGIICYNILRSRENGTSNSTLYSIEIGFSFY